MDCVFLTVKVMYKEGEEGRWVGYDIVKQVLDITDTQPFPFFFFFFSTGLVHGDLVRARCAVCVHTQGTRNGAGARGKTGGRGGGELGSCMWKEGWV